MLIKINKPSFCNESEITPQEWFLSRRKFIEISLGAAAIAALGGGFSEAQAAIRVDGYLKGKLPKGEEKLTSFKDATSYNNFYELSTDKQGPAELAGSMRPDPWSVSIEGEVAKPGTLALEDLIKPHRLEERIYRFRCVEGWSMVVPWIGVPLADVLKRFEPTSRAKYVEFTTLFDPKQFPGQRRAVLEWPYVEGLRLDEAMHPLTLLAVGMYGQNLPGQNGAPLRLVTPWKYGFKNVKSIVKIRLLEKQPISTWMKAGPTEYGFYANVNPKVDHPRWSQARERRLGEFLKRDTLMFNGYAEEVASLYTGMDLKKNF